MAIAGQTNVNNARTTFETLVDGANQMEKSQGGWVPFARRFDGTGARKIEITVVGATPDYEEWEGAKNYRGFRKRIVAIPFHKYHKSIELDRADVEHDQNGSTAVALADLTRNVGYIWDKVVFTKLASNPTVADGSSLIANSHNSGTLDNLTTEALNFDTFDAGRVALRNQTDEFGEFLGIEVDTLLVNPDEERIALEIAQADARPISVGTGGVININGAGIGATQIANVYRGLVTVIVTPRWTAGDWMIMDSRFPPIALGVWRDPTAVIQDRMEDEARFNLDKYRYSVEADVNASGLTHHGCYGAIA